MIQNKELGLKIAENSLEALWIKEVERSEQRLIDLKNSLVIETAFLELAKQELKKSTKPSNK